MCTVLAQKNGTMPSQLEEKHISKWHSITKPLGKYTNTLKTIWDKELSSQNATLMPILGKQWELCTPKQAEKPKRKRTGTEAGWESDNGKMGGSPQNDGEETQASL